MKYNITIHREIVGKYWNHNEVKDDSDIKTIHHDEYSDLSFEILKDILIGEIDPPEKMEKMTEESVRKNFETDLLGKLSDESVNSIMTYYNSRLDMYNQIMKEINDENFKYISIPLTKDNDTFDTYNNCELYAKLKTWHLLVSQFRLTNDITIINRGLKLHKRNFPMFRRYKI